MITVRLLKFAGPKRHSVVRLFDETAAAEVLVYPEAGQLLRVSGLHGYGTALYPRSLDELASDVLSALEENGYGETTETIKGETFNDIEETLAPGRWLRLYARKPTTYDRETIENSGF